jgi:hypothetical protein
MPLSCCFADGCDYKSCRNSEGALKVPTFCDPDAAPFALPYSMMVPKRGEVDNLLVPVAVSASHIAFNAVRSASSPPPPVAVSASHISFNGVCFASSPPPPVAVFASNIWFNAVCCASPPPPPPFHSFTLSNQLRPSHNQQVLFLLSSTFGMLEEARG